jgi:biopolymer transport protein ExbD
MLRLRRNCQVQAKIPDASMADVAFLLIIFFLVTKSFFSFDKTPVTLPASLDLVRADLPTRGAVNVAITATGDLRVDNLKVSLVDVRTIAEGAVARDKNRLFILRADQSVAYKHVDAVLERLRQAGVLNIAFETRSGGGGFLR